jgi:hypothetical protein
VDKILLELLLKSYGFEADVLCIKAQIETDRQLHNLTPDGLIEVSHN